VRLRRIILAPSKGLLDPPGNLKSEI